VFAVALTATLVQAERAAAARFQLPKSPVPVVPGRTNVKVPTGTPPAGAFTLTTAVTVKISPYTTVGLEIESATERVPAAGTKTFEQVLAPTEDEASGLNVPTMV